MHILLLTARDWTHPQAGGTGTSLYGHVARWLAGGHRVTVVAGDHEGAAAGERPTPNLTIHHMGSRTTVVPRAAWATLRGLGRDADVVLEVVDGMAFCTPAWWWLDAPTVALVPGVHHDRYVGDRRRQVAALLAERAPLRLLYRSTPVLTSSEAARDDLVALGVPREHVHVGDLAVEPPVVDEQAGVVADTPQALAGRVAALVSDDARRQALGEAPRARGRGFTWDRAAGQSLAVLERAAAGGRSSLRAGLRRSETAKAAGMAVATLGSNALAIVFTVVFTRLLGVGDYGALGALLSTFTILAVAGTALQVAVARETALGHLGGPGAVGAAIRRYLAQLAVAGVAVTAASVVLREEIAELIAVPQHAWAAAAILPTGVLWLVLSVLRGALQGVHAYGAVGLSLVVEALGRLLVGLVLVLGGAGVTGAFLGTPLSMAVAGVALWVLLRRRVGAAPVETAPRSLTSLVSGGWAPIVGLVFLAALQNVDVIVAKREMTDDAAGAYAAAVVAAKLVVWVAIGIGLYLLPEATRRAGAGLDPRPVFLRTLAMLGLVSVPALAIFALVPTLLLRVAFGEAFTSAAGALVLLGAAMTLLAVSYLAVQYMLALRQVAFLWVLGVVAVAEPFLLTAGDLDLVAFSGVVLALQCVAAAGALTLGLRRVPA